MLSVLFLAVSPLQSSSGITGSKEPPPFLLVEIPGTVFSTCCTLLIGTTFRPHREVPAFPSWLIWPFLVLYLFFHSPFLPCRIFLLPPFVPFFSLLHPRFTSFTPCAPTHVFPPLQPFFAQLSSFAFHTLFFILYLFFIYNLPHLFYIFGHLFFTPMVRSHRQKDFPLYRPSPCCPFRPQRGGCIF